MTVPKVIKLLNLSLIDVTTSKYFKKLVLDAMDYRKKNNIVRLDMNNTLMKRRAGTNEMNAETEQSETLEFAGFATVEESSIGKTTVKRQWNDNELVAQCFMFFLAGFDSSSTALSFTSHEFALNVDVQKKLYAEIFETNAKLEGNRISYDQLNQMKYMDMVVSEGLRYWPPSPMTDRLCVKDYEYDDGEIKFKMEKGLIYSGFQ